MNYIVQNPGYLDYSTTVYGSHGMVHNYISDQMATMYSPSDPLFWSHHSNIERLYCIWQDCYDYESIDPDDLTDTQYTAYPPNTICSGSPNYDIDTEMPYFYQGEKTLMISNFPNPRDLHSCGSVGKPGYDNLWVIYGSDIMVQNLESDPNDEPYCKANQVGWSIVNQPAPGETQSKRKVKRTLSSNATFSNASNEEYTLDFLAYHLAAAAEAGLSGVDVLEYIADIECMASPQREIDDQLEKWIIMEGGELSWYDRRCDNSSARFCSANPDHPLCYEEEEEEVEKLEKSESNLLIVVIGEGVIIGILLILVVVVYISKKTPTSPDNYASL